MQWFVQQFITVGRVRRRASVLFERKIREVFGTCSTERKEPWTARMYINLEPRIWLTERWKLQWNVTSRIWVTIFFKGNGLRPVLILSFLVCENHRYCRKIVAHGEAIRNILHLNRFAMHIYRLFNIIRKTERNRLNGWGTDRTRMHTFINLITFEVPNTRTTPWLLKCYFWTAIFWRCKTAIATQLKFVKVLLPLSIRKLLSYIEPSMEALLICICQHHIRCYFIRQLCTPRRIVCTIDVGSYYEGFITSRT